MNLFQSNVLAKGSFQELQSSGFDFVKMFGSSDETATDSVLECENTENSSFVTSPILPSLGSNDKTASVVAVNKLNKSLGEPNEGTENLSNNSERKSKCTYVQYMSASGSTCKIFFLFAMYTITQVINTGTDYWITYWYYVR